MAQPKNISMVTQCTRLSQICFTIFLFLSHFHTHAPCAQTYRWFLIVIQLHYSGFTVIAFTYQRNKANCITETFSQ